MAKRGERYTPLGKRIHRLSRTQAELGQVLGLTQQSISGKLNGRIAVTTQDLERLAEAYRVPLLYFFLPEPFSAEQARQLDEGMQQPDGAQMQLLEILNVLPLVFRQQLLAVARAIAQTAMTLHHKPVNLTATPQVPAPRIRD